MVTKWIKHIYKDGARFHVLWWDSFGRHCSEPNCEINRDTDEYNQKHKREDDKEANCVQVE